MRQVSKILLNKHKAQYKDAESQEQAEKDFNASWRSAKLILDAMEVHIKEQLNSLIKADEDIKNMELPDSLPKHFYNLGARAETRRVLTQLLQCNEYILGDE